MQRTPQPSGTLRFACTLLVAIAICLSGQRCTAQQVVFVVNSSGSLYEVDLTTCSSNLIGYTGVVFFDIAHCPNSGLLYGVTDMGELYIIDQLTAAITYVGYTGEELDAMVCTSTGVVFAASNANDHLYLVNTSSGWATSLGSTGVGGTSGGDLTFYNGQLYWSTEANEMVQVDPLFPGNSIILGYFQGVNDVYGIVSVLGCTQEVFVSAGSAFYSMNMTTLATAVQCAFVVPGDIYGAASTTETVVNPSLQPAGPFCESDPPVALQASVGGGTWSASCGGCINNTNGVFDPRCV